MFQKLHEVENRYRELERLLTDSKVLGNPKELQKLARERDRGDDLIQLALDALDLADLP
jgi:protein subunit release factor A